ncbi:MAG: nucleotidyl transferase AbiEii/AbiGii toxin family protein [Kiritimatiellae bacterium]|nr:nucleotidyl transferase AbiEii/AbiGii toxin family protein [Kiritimatiellia bacterium]
MIGGLAIFELGLARMTEDIDLLVDSDPNNVVRIKKALAGLPDNAVRDVEPTDVREYLVVRVNDEVTIDLMASACGIGYKQASAMVLWREIEGVRIPFATPELLWLTKQTHREKDALDRAYLRKLFADRGIEPPSR